MLMKITINKAIKKEEEVTSIGMLLQLKELNTDILPTILVEYLDLAIQYVKGERFDYSYFKKVDDQAFITAEEKKKFFYYYTAITNAVLSEAIPFLSRYSYLKKTLGVRA